jgi:predicted cupin superfamily sugar epimerase
MKARDLVEKLALQSHPEGGWYREIYRARGRVQVERGSRSALTTIYYLLEQQQLSRWHVVESDEVWHFHAGAPLELLEYDPATGQLVQHVLGDVRQGNEAVAVIPPGAWQAARSRGDWSRSSGDVPSGDYSLVGCTVGPGFEFEDFRFVRALPGHERHFTGALARFVDLL